MIPARYDTTEEGREKLGVAELESMLSLEEIPDSPPPPEMDSDNLEWETIQSAQQTESEGITGD